MFDVTNPFDYHLVILGMRTTVERQRPAKCGFLVGRQEQTISSEVFKADSAGTDFRKHFPETMFGQ